MRDELSAIAEPILAELIEHPFWAGLRNGSVPPESLWYFAEQDARHVVPTYARALASCAAIAGRDGHGALLATAAQGTFGSLERLDTELAKLADALGRPRPAGTVTPGPQVHAYTSFMRAAPAASFASGVGALLPMTSFHLTVSRDLKERCVPGSRYAGWIDQYVAYDGYDDYVAAYLTMVDEVALDCSAGERARLVERFRLAARHEWAFAESAWERQEWGVGRSL